MNTVAERIYEADRHDAIENMKSLMAQWGEKERGEFLSHLVLAQDVYLAREFFGLESMGVLEVDTTVLQADTSIVLPDEKQVFTPYRRDTGDMLMHELSKKELSFMLRAFFPDVAERDYVIETIFLHHNFLRKNLTDIQDFMDGTEVLFATICGTGKRAMHIVTDADTSSFEAPEAANDERFAPISERIDPKWYEYSQKVHKLRLEYLESLFCQTVAILADTEANRLWAMDPEHFSFTVPEKERSHIELIASICDFHRLVEPSFPNLTTMLEGAVASWILVYQGFSAHAHDIREGVHHESLTKA